MRPPSGLFKEKASWYLITAGVAALAFLGGCLIGKASAPPAPFGEVFSAAVESVKPQPNATRVDNSIGSGFEYQLSFESEEHWSALKTHINEKVAQSMAAKRDRFEKTLMDLNVSKDEARDAMAHAGKVMLASIEVEAMQQQFLKAQSDYDRRMHRLLSAEDYAKYRLFEESKKFLFEYKSFQKYASKQELPDFSPFEADIQNAIYEAQAYTMSFLHGPYDGMPNVGMGKKTALERLQQDMARINMSSAQLLETRSAEKLPSECLKALQNYYSACLEHMKAREKKLKADLLQSTAKS